MPAPEVGPTAYGNQTLAVNALARSASSTGRWPG